MVIFWGRPAADCRFHRRSAYHLPQPSFTITAVFFVICGPCCRRQAASRGHLCCHWLSFLAATVFFCLATVHCFAGLSAAVPLLHRCVGRLLSWPPNCALFQPSLPCPRLSTVQPRRCRHPEFSSSLISLLGSGLTTFSRHSTLLQQQAVGVLGISSPPCCRSMRPLSGRAVRRAVAVILPSPGLLLLAVPRLRLHAPQWDNLSSTAATPDAYSPL